MNPTARPLVFSMCSDCPRKPRFHRLVTLSVLVLFAPWPQAWADSFVYTTIDVGPSPYTTVLTGINDSEQIIGNYLSGGSTTAFLYDHGSITTLAFPLPGAVAYGINDAGQVIGSYWPGHPQLSSAGFLYSQGVLTLLNVPGSSSPYYPQEPLTGVGGINNLGQIVGTYFTASGQELGFLYSNGTYTTINAGGDLTMAYSINDLGQIVGRVGEQGFLDVNGQFTLLNVPGSNFTEATGINDAGQIVGRFIGNEGQQGFLYDQGTYYTINLVSPRAAVAFV